MDSSALKPILEFCTVFATSVLNHIFGSLVFSKTLHFIKTYSKLEILFRDWVASISSILVVLLIALNGDAGLQAVGLWVGQQQIEANEKAILGGLFFIFLFLGAVAVGQQLRLRRRKQATQPGNPQPPNPSAVKTLQFQTRPERLAYLSVLPYMVISEELVYRGYLVLFLGSQTGTFVLWILLSMILSVMIHLYQGRSLRLMAFHALFAGFFICLALLTGNLLMSIAAHLAYNLAWSFQTWKRAGSLDLQPEPPQAKQSNLDYFVLAGFNALLLLGFLFFLLVSE
jgi:membrane protease YdiL (CAAX protease family)